MWLRRCLRWRLSSSYKHGSSPKQSAIRNIQQEPHDYMTDMSWAMLPTRAMAQIEPACNADTYVSPMFRGYVSVGEFLQTGLLANRLACIGLSPGMLLACCWHVPGALLAYPWLRGCFHSAPACSCHASGMLLACLWHASGVLLAYACGMLLACA